MWLQYYRSIRFPLTHLSHLPRCLQTNEAGGMGEGWSDTMAFWSEQSSDTPEPFTMGSYVENNSAGIRSVPYSPDMSVDPYTYGTVATKSEGELCRVLCRPVA